MTDDRTPRGSSPGDPGHAVLPSRRIWTAAIWRLDNAALDRVATAATFLLLCLSRFALLPSGPWEWDETLFARGLLRFDLRAHFPHPPGFPLWILLGKAMLPFVSEALRGLQLRNAAGSPLKGVTVSQSRARNRIARPAWR